MRRYRPILQMSELNLRRCWPKGAQWEGGWARSETNTQLLNYPTTLPAMLANCSPKARGCMRVNWLGQIKGAECFWILAFNWEGKCCGLSRVTCGKKHFIAKATLINYKQWVDTPSLFRIPGLFHTHPWAFIGSVFIASNTFPSLLPSWLFQTNVPAPWMSGNSFSKSIFIWPPCFLKNIQ